VGVRALSGDAAFDYSRVDRVDAGHSVTMRNLRLKRAIFFVWRVQLEMDEVHCVAMVLRAFPTAELEPLIETLRGPPCA
jgi:hypothetical protein